MDFLSEIEDFRAWNEKQWPPMMNTEDGVTVVIGDSVSFKTKAHLSFLNFSGLWTPGANVDSMANPLSVQRQPEQPLGLLEVPSKIPRNPFGSRRAAVQRDRSRAKIRLGAA